MRSGRATTAIIRLIVGLCCAASQLSADTLISLRGGTVLGGGSLAVQVFDGRSGAELHVVRRRVPSSGLHAWVGLRGPADTRIRAGVNERGLILIAIPSAEVRMRGGRPFPDDPAELLERYPSVESLIDAYRRRELRGPTRMIVGDAWQHALFELLADGSGGLQVASDGVLISTGFFTLPGLERQEPAPIPLGALGRFSAAVGQIGDVPALAREDLMTVVASHEGGWGAAPICRHGEDVAAGGADSVGAVLFERSPGAFPRIWLARGHPCRKQYREVPWIDRAR